MRNRMNTSVSSLEESCRKSYLLSCSSPKNLATKSRPRRRMRAKMTAEASTQPVRHSARPPHVPYITPAMTCTNSPGMNAITICRIWMSSMMPTPRMPRLLTHSSNCACVTGSLSMSMTGEHSLAMSHTTPMSAMKTTAKRAILPRLGILEKSGIFMRRAASHLRRIVRVIL